MVVTFLPYPDIQRSLQCLDRTRINKQKVETFQILKALDGGGSNHPATLMWKGYEEMLKVYYNACIDECVSRGYNNTMEYVEVGDDVEEPWWWEWDHFHLSHQASLVRKHPCYYEPIFVDLPSFYLERGYVWPSKFTIDDVDSDDVFAPINTDTMKSASKSKELLYTVQDLKQMCRDRGIRGYSRLKKLELMELLEL